MKKPQISPNVEAQGSSERLDAGASDLIFVKGRERDRISNPDVILRDALGTALNYPGRDEIYRISTLENARKAFDSLYSVSNIISNADLTIAFQIDQNAAVPTLYEKIFFSVKRILGTKRGLANIKEKIFSNLDLKREFLLARMQADLQEAFRTVCKDEVDREQFVRELLADAGVLPASQSLSESFGRSSGSSHSMELPKAAPSLWLERTDRQETAPDFIKRVYAPWLGQGMTRVDIRHLDRSLYTALAKWLRSNDMPAD